MDETIEIAQRFYSPRELADAWGLSQQAVTSWLRAGILPGFQFGKVWRVPESSVQKFLRQVRREADAKRAGGLDDGNLTTVLHECLDAAACGEPYIAERESA